MTKVFLIHDKLRTDRLKLYTKEILVQDIEYEIMPAVKEYENVQKNISEAHKNCIRRAQRDGCDRVVILEDDVKFACPGAFKRFLDLSFLLPGNWDIFTAGSYEYKVVGTMGHGIIKEPIAKLHRFSGLHCYMVHCRYYDKFLLTRGVNNLDKALVGELYMTWPQMALQHNTWSDNVHKMTNYNETFKNRIKLWQRNTLTEKDSGKSSGNMDTPKDG